MIRRYAAVILDITSPNLDRSFTYLVPDELIGKVRPGMAVIVPLGKSDRPVKAFVLSLEEKSSFPAEKLKPILEISPEDMAVEGQMIALADFIHLRYGTPMISCLKTVLPVSKKVAPVVAREVKRAANDAAFELEIAACRRKNQSARLRILLALPKEGTIPYSFLTGKLGCTKASIDPLVKKGLIEITEVNRARNPFHHDTGDKKVYSLTGEQEKALSVLKETYYGDKKPVLIHGITGSGKTLLYIEMIEEVIRSGRQAIVLIPEIALTYQTMMRFHNRFGGRVSFIHSKLSKGERHDQFELAKQGKLDIMIGPRSAVFTPFKNLGLIIIDEEHETSYKSETAPRYHTKEVAIERARLTKGLVVLGSATPSMDSAYEAAKGNYRLISLRERAVAGASLPAVRIVDMREELKKGNKSMFSDALQEALYDRLQKKEQSMLFLNRRGYDSFISCRSCGEALKCPHCDVTLTYHKDHSLRCHYCGYAIPMVKACPLCGSSYVAGFGTGTQKVEEQLQKLYPDARILRMDMDTTTGKDGHEEIIRAFANHEADILVGTQMIVKGHDFHNVTLVGALAADTALYASDYSAAEKTFALLCQAAGRAGRGEKPGEMIIQTYKPEHYSITASAEQNFAKFYRSEIAFRRLMHYPPVISMAKIIISCKREEAGAETANEAGIYLRQIIKRGDGQVLGPTPAPIKKMNDIFYFNLFLRCVSNELLSGYLLMLSERMEWTKLKKDVMIQFDIQ